MLKDLKRNPKLLIFILIMAVIMPVIGSVLHVRWVAAQSSFKYYTDITISNPTATAYTTRVFFPINPLALVSGAYMKANGTDTELYQGAALSPLMANSLASSAANWYTGIISLPAFSVQSYRLYLGDPTYTRNQKLVSLNTDTVSIAHVAGNMDWTGVVATNNEFGISADVYFYSYPSTRAYIFEIPNQYGMYINATGGLGFHFYTATNNYSFESATAPVQVTLNTSQWVRAILSLTSVASVEFYNLRTGTNEIQSKTDGSIVVTTTNPAYWSANSLFDNIIVGSGFGLTNRIVYTFEPNTIYSVPLTTVYTILDTVGTSHASVTFTGNPHASVTAILSGLTPTGVSSAGVGATPSAPEVVSTIAAVNMFATSAVNANAFGYSLVDAMATSSGYSIKAIYMVLLTILAVGLFVVAYVVVQSLIWAAFPTGVVIALGAVWNIYNWAILALYIIIAGGLMILEARQTI
ncbi:MAG: hypothetical protein US53_C0036G0007 [Candidatus Woesebacteria bacterium GW2011_GWA1_37_7]|uniref:Uncharacterized protein n=1 Tax=Candidatus Woesebacteria bacterium GW2011_GWA1_37_7 TaxID=1618545 RepID=A0A0G0HE47_9BACT|nr:MAG: hypothetical protein US53_C0036G0007 [Candidatus Woesebacteria bacterium GW2011_GWA1_37_7]